MVHPKLVLGNHCKTRGVLGDLCIYILLILPRSTCGASVGSSATVLLPLLETT